MRLFTDAAGDAAWRAPTRARCVGIERSSSARVCELRYGCSGRPTAAARSRAGGPDPEAATRAARTAGTRAGAWLRVLRTTRPPEPAVRDAPVALETGARTTGGCATGCGAEAGCAGAADGGCVVAAAAAAGTGVAGAAAGPGGAAAETLAGGAGAAVTVGAGGGGGGGAGSLGAARGGRKASGSR